MAVGGIFYGEDGHGLLGQFQRNEYIRYSRQIRAPARPRLRPDRHRVDVPRPGLRAVAASTRCLHPGGPRQRVRHGGAHRGQRAHPRPEVPRRASWRPRRRAPWSPSSCRRGATSGPSACGGSAARWRTSAPTDITPATAPLLGPAGRHRLRRPSRSTASGCSCSSRSSPSTSGCGSRSGSSSAAIFVVERVVTVWRGGWKARLLAVLLFPELAYDMFLDAVFVKGLSTSPSAATARWGHVSHSAARRLRRRQ